MEAVNFLAQLWGFSLIIVCLSFLVKPKHVENIFALAQNQTALLIVGLFDILLGVASLLAYNSWDHSWRTLITIVSWLVLLKGVLYLFVPEKTVEMMTKWKNQYMNWLPIGLVVGVVLGCVMVYLGMNF